MYKKSKKNSSSWPYYFTFRHLRYILHTFKLVFYEMKSLVNLYVWLSEVKELRTSVSIRFSLWM